MTNTMRAVHIEKSGGPEVLRLTDRPLPAPAADEVRVSVAAAGVNRPDVLQRRGQYPPPPGASDLPGLEVAGIVDVVGESVQRWNVGDRVTALVTGGGYAEACIAPAVQCLPIPDGLDFVQAAAVPETFFTVWTNLFERGRLQAHESVLIHGGTSGIGTTAIQLARAFKARVFATAGSRAKCEACERLGAERAIPYTEEDFVTVVRDKTEGRGVDVCLDIIGAKYLSRNIDALASNGRLVVIGLLGGARAEVDLARMLTRRLSLTGSTLRPRPSAEKGRIADALEKAVWPLLAAGTVAPVIDSTLPLAEAAEAHRRMESNAHIGKIVLTVGDLG